jgi:D-amino peptidase
MEQKMNVYIQTDIEGIAGWISHEDRETQTIENYEHRQRMYRLLTAEVNAAVLAAKQCGAERILVNDSHGSGYNIIFEELDECCEINHGRGEYFPDWLPVLDEGFDAMVLIGMHAMGGEVGGICPHSKWEINGGEIYMSEASSAAAIAGDLGIPTVFISGDQIITGEVGEKIPDIEKAIVKHSYGPNCCRSVQPTRACKMIFEGVKSGLQRIAEIRPYKLAGPFTLNLLDSPGFIPPLKPLLERPVEGQTFTEVHNKALDKFPWTHFGQQVVDAYRYPGNLTPGNPTD